MPVAADKPCTRCGRPVHFSYKGPVEGVCGRCADRLRRSERGGARTRLVRVRDAFPRGALVAAAAGGFLAGAVAGAFLQALFRVL